MNAFVGLIRYSYRMSIRRWSLWIVNGLLMVLYVTTILMPPALAEVQPTADNLMQYAGTYGFMLNLFMPLVGGILAADRLVRDRRLRVDELLESTSLRRWQYVLGKYLGVLLSLTTPVLITCLLVGAAAAVNGAPWTIIPAMGLSFLGMNLPGFAFVTAFALGCPLIMPLRVFQVLFTGYWFWGNYLSPEVMPTLNGTYLTANGEFPLYGFFGGFYGGGGPNYVFAPTATDAVINLAVLAVFAGLALLATERVLARGGGRN